ncbi:MAG TPA: hypothetical protein VF228_11260 [Iamia sp.]
MSPRGLARLAQRGIDVPAQVVQRDGTLVSGRTIPYPVFIDGIGLPSAPLGEDRGHPALLHLREVFVTPPADGPITYEPCLEIQVADIASCAVSYRSYFPFTNN